MTTAGRILAILLILSSALLFLLPTTMPTTTQTPLLNTPQVHRTFWLNGTIFPSATWNKTLPGPRLVVNSGDRITLMLKSADPIPHLWFIDFNNNTIQDSNETFASQPTNYYNYVNYTFTPDIGINVTRAGTYAYRCAYHSAMRGTITINQPPLPPPPPQLSAAFMISPVAPVPGQAAIFTPTVTGGTQPYSFIWNFGDGTPNSTMQIPTHSYSNAGTFTIKLAVTDSGSPKQTSTQTLSLVVSPPPPPPTITLTSLLPNPTFPGQQVQIQFKAIYSNGPVTLTWIDWGDHTTPDLLLNVTSPSMCPKLIPGSQSNQCAIAPGDIILARPQDPATIVNGSIIVFNNPQNPNFVIVHRVVGIMPPTATNPEYSFKTQGDANLISDCFTPSCYIPASWILAVYQPTPPPIPTIFCIPENPCPTGPPGPRYDFHTYANLGSSQTQTYTVSINATDTDGTHAEITTLETVNDRPPSVTISSLSPSSITEGSTATLTFSAIDLDGKISTITITWGDGTTSSNLPGTTTSQTHRYTTLGTLTISVSATDNSGSTSPVATSYVTINPQPSPSAPAPKILGLDPTMFYVLVAVGLAAVTTATVIALRTWRPKA